MNTTGEPMRLERAQLDDWVAELRVTGEVDVATGPRFGVELGQALADGAVLIDVRACGYIDSMGIGALVRAARRERQGRIVVLCAPSGAVRKVIDAVGLDALVPVLESREDALDTLAAARRAD
jgi:anti-anti-sigma factor